ncbi:MAG: hypothetical protein KKD11_08550 [Candidatus Omnitrophica bacterium]|nr:hypothetical protein [Candidatus Omnitrophota bacterium]
MSIVDTALFNRLIAENPKDRDSLQKELLKKIQDKSGRKTISYLANFKTHPFNMISFDDKSYLVLLMDSVSNNAEEIDFILHSPGGFAESVEMMVKLLRSRFKKVRFIIPHTAKSAATMLALSGNEILMSSSAELGPIDPQVSGAISGPAQSIIDGFEDIKKTVEKEKKLNGAYVPILNKMDVATVKRCENSLKYGRSIVKDWIVKYMFSEDKISPRKKKVKANSISKYFSDHRMHLTHGRPIMWEDAAKRSVKARSIENIDRDLAALIKEYFLRFEYIFHNIAINKIFQSEKEYMVSMNPVIPRLRPAMVSPLPISPQKPTQPQPHSPEKPAQSQAVPQE